MNTPSTKGRALAIVAGLAFTAGGLTILLGPVVTKPLEWSAYHVLTILTVFGTIAAGHLMVDAGRARHLPAAFGFLVLFLAGTGLVVYNSVGRQAETTDANALTAEATNKAIHDKYDDLDGAKDRLTEANNGIAKEMRGERCGPRCNDWKQRAKEVSAHIAQIEGEIKALGPQKPVNAKAAKAADMAALFGFDRSKALAVFTLIEPFLSTLFFEIGSIVSLGFAFRSNVSAKIPAQNAKSAKSFDQRKAEALATNDNITDLDLVAVAKLFRSDIEPVDPNGSGGGKVIRPKRWQREDVRADLTARLERGESWPSQRAMAATYGVPTSTLSEWLSHWAAEGEAVRRQQIGRRKAVG